MFRALCLAFVLAAGVALAQDGGAQLASDATSKVAAISGPLIALGLALIALTLALSVIAYLNNRIPKD